MFVTLVVAVFVLALVSLSAADDSTLYVFAYSWTPEFCYGNTATYPGCSNTTSPYYASWGKYFTIHGLWPQYYAGSYPADCTTEAFDVSVVNALGYNNFLEHWPNVQYAESDPNYPSFWEHEWTKHGTCSGLTQANYFQNALNVLKTYPTPAIISASVGKDVSAADVRAAFGGAEYVSLQCENGQYLSGAFLCLSQKNGIPNGQVVCPADVHAEDTCTSATIGVPSL